MANETQAGVIPEQADPVQPAQGVTPEAIDPAEFSKMQAALKEANAEAAKRRKQLEAYEKAEADRKTAEMTEIEKANAKLKEYEDKLSRMERAALIRKIADEVGLPASLADRLQGGTEEELKADAQKLMELVPQKPKSIAGSPTNPGSAQRSETAAEKRARLLGGPVNIWEGGGVIWDKEP